MFLSLAEKSKIDNFVAGKTEEDDNKETDCVGTGHMRLPLQLPAPQPTSGELLLPAPQPTPRELRLPAPQPTQGELRLPAPQPPPADNIVGQQQPKSSDNTLAGQQINTAMEIQQSMIPPLNQGPLPVQLPNGANLGFQMPLLKQQGDMRPLLLPSNQMQPRLLVARQNSIPPPPPLLPMGQIPPSALPGNQNQIILSPGVQVNQMPVLKAMPSNPVLLNHNQILNQDQIVPTGGATSQANQNQAMLTQIVPVTPPANQNQVPLTQLVPAPTNPNSVTLTIIPGDQIRPAVSQSILSPTMVPVSGLIPVPRNTVPQANQQASNMKPLKPLPSNMKSCYAGVPSDTPPDGTNKLTSLSNGPVNGLAAGSKHTVNNVIRGKAKDGNNNKSNSKDIDGVVKPKSKRGRKLGQCKYSHTYSGIFFFSSSSRDSRSSRGSSSLNWILWPRNTCKRQLRCENFANLPFWPILAPNPCIFLHKGGSQLSTSF